MDSFSLIGCVPSITCYEFIILTSRTLEERASGFPQPLFMGWNFANSSLLDFYSTTKIDIFYVFH